MGWWSVECGPLKLVEDKEALIVVGVVRHGHGDCGSGRPPRFVLLTKAEIPSASRATRSSLRAKYSTCGGFLHSRDVVCAA